MIIRYFNRTKPINIVLLAIILLFLALTSFFIKNESFSFLQVSKFILIFISFVIFKISTTNKLVPSETDYGIFFYVLLSGLFLSSFFNLSIIIANLIFMIALMQLHGVGNKEVNEKEKLFNYGFLIGAAHLFFPLVTLYLLLGFIAVLVFNKLNWRTLLIPFIGYIAVLLLLFLLNDLFEIQLVTFSFLKLKMYIPYLFDSLLLIITTAFVLLLIIWSILVIPTSPNPKLVKYKTFHFLIIAQLLITIAFMVIRLGEATDSVIIFAIFPLSILLSNSIPSIRRKWVSNTIVGILILLLVLNYSF